MIVPGLFCLVSPLIRDRVLQLVATNQWLFTVSAPVVNNSGMDLQTHPKNLRPSKAKTLHRPTSTEVPPGAVVFSEPTFGTESTGRCDHPEMQNV